MLFSTWDTSRICVRSLAVFTTPIADIINLHSRAANNFPAGAGQIVQSNLFFLGHIPFLAGQTLIIITLNLKIFKP